MSSNDSEGYYHLPQVSLHCSEVHYSFFFFFYSVQSEAAMYSILTRQLGGSLCACPFQLIQLVSVYIWTDNTERRQEAEGNVQSGFPSSSMLSIWVCKGLDVLLSGQSKAELQVENVCFVGTNSISTVHNTSVGIICVASTSPYSQKNWQEINGCLSSQPPN